MTKHSSISAKARSLKVAEFFSPIFIREVLNMGSNKTSPRYLNEKVLSIARADETVGELLDDKVEMEKLEKKLSGHSLRVYQELLAKFGLYVPSTAEVKTLSPSATALIAEVNKTAKK